MRQDQRMREVETHQESQVISWVNVRLLCRSLTHTAKAWQWNYTGTKTAVSPVTLGYRDSWALIHCTVLSFWNSEKLWPSKTFSLPCSTRRCVFHLCCKKSPMRAVLPCTTKSYSLSPWCVIKLFSMFFPCSHSSQACCKWIPHVAQALEKEQSDLVSHPTAMQAADSDPGLALPALTLHFLQSGLMTLSLGSASASELGCSSFSQETSTPFTALL